MGQGSTLAI